METRNLYRLALPLHDPHAAEAGQAMARAIGHFARIQDAEGFWWGELESNATMEAEYILLTHFVGAKEPERWARIAQDIRHRQNENGSWSMYAGAPGDLSTTAECYFALKLVGARADEPHMVKARRFVLEKGGLAKTRTFTRIWLALFGQFPWNGIPAMPPELMLLPDSAPLSIYKFASWARATIVPMTILLSDRPVCPVPPEARIDELHLSPADSNKAHVPRRGSLFSWETVFLGVDRLLRAYEKKPVRVARELARRKAEEWIVAHQEADGSWAGIQPPWVYSLMALKQLGYGLDHPVMKKGLEGFKARWSLDFPDGRLRVQACLSPVWDTCLAMLGLLDSGVPGDDPMLLKAARWLLDEEIRVPGDWCVNVKGVEPSGWAFEFENDLYPDVDDTAIVLMVLNRVRFPGAKDERDREAALRRGVEWTLAMQSSNGGWAAFDKDNTSRIPALLPFCDFGEVLDPPSVDVTAHVVEMLGQLGFTRSHPAVRRALEFIYSEQEDDGSWFGRWGVNHVYGIGAVLPALAAVGEDMTSLPVRRACWWLFSRQNLDGGWGESCASYVDTELRGRGASTASQTGWALMALVSAGLADDPATRRGVRYLAATQQPDGSWDEAHFTGCGFPGYGIGEEPDELPREGDAHYQGRELSAGFMIKYHLYRNYFPLMGLGRWREAVKAAVPMRPAEVVTATEAPAAS